MATQPIVSTKPVTDRPANPTGKVFIVEYHNIASKKNPYFRSPADFKADLERFYKDGFRPVTVTDYLSGKMPIPPGASPMVFTFDDADPSQIKFRDDGSLDPQCALGIWSDFVKTHPDFPVRATFFVLPNMWNQPKWVQKKIALVHSLGSELADHTVTHPPLRKRTDEQVKSEIGQAWVLLEKLGEKPPYNFAYPFGSHPKNMLIMSGFQFQGQTIKPKCGLNVGAEPAPAPTDPKLDIYRIPRVQATTGVDGIDYWLDEFEKGRVKVFVEG